MELARIAPEDIETFSVLKDASATADVRGSRGKWSNHVNHEKGGRRQRVCILRYESIFSMPTKEIDVVDPITYMRMYNQALMGRSQASTPKYSEETINRTLSGKYPSWLYPQNDWYDVLFKRFNVNHHAGISIRGDSKVVHITLL